MGIVEQDMGQVVLANGAKLERAAFEEVEGKVDARQKHAPPPEIPRPKIGRQHRQERQQAEQLAPVVREPLREVVEQHEKPRESPVDACSIILRADPFGLKWASGGGSLRRLYGFEKIGVS